ncbi:MAG TPA: tripartite tricarboxylate transporter substrate binding protein [Burkholderiaceae bacterium]|nr:tripartite tricarboxylate transporter substrate binding protein [Burkholderiaceae bacterium]
MKAVAAMLLTLGLALPASQARAQADDFPNRAMRMIVSIGPGGGADLMIRALADQLSSQFGQPVVVENRPGGDGVVAAQALLSAPADGYTMSIVSTGITVINPILIPNLPFKTSDFQPLAGMARPVAVFAVPAASKSSSLAALMDRARPAPDSVTMGTYGPIYKIPSQMLERKLDVQFNHVAYKGPSQLLADLSGGNIDVGFLDAGAVAPMVRTGKLKGLAVTSRSRLDSLPDVPTLREAGINDFDPPIWNGVAVRAGTPEPVARKLEAALQRAMKSAAWKDLLARLGNVEPWPASSEELARTFVVDGDFYRKAAAAAGLK